MQKSGRGTSTSGTAGKLRDIMFCLEWLEQTAEEAGFKELARLIGIARIAGDDLERNPQYMESLRLTPPPDDPTTV